MYLINVNCIINRITECEAKEAKPGTNRILETIQAQKNNMEFNKPLHVPFPLYWDVERKKPFHCTEGMVFSHTIKRSEFAPYIALLLGVDKESVIKKSLEKKEETKEETKKETKKTKEPRNEKQLYLAVQKGGVEYSFHFMKSTSPTDPSKRFWTVMSCSPIPSRNNGAQDPNLYQKGKGCRLIHPLFEHLSKFPFSVQE